MKRMYIVTLLILSIVTATAGHTYTGSLSIENGGIQGTGLWIDKLLLPPNQQQNWTSPVISWVVTKNTDNTWHYTYTFSVYKGEVSHFILETSANFTKADIFNATGAFRSSSIGWHRSGDPGNPNLPADIYGIKFDGTSGLTLNIAFDSPKVPVWGDFYAKDGKTGTNITNTAWNAGITSADPTAHAGDGSVNNKILVPDTFAEMPEPSSMILTLTGIVGLAGIFTKRTR